MTRRTVAVSALSALALTAAALVPATAAQAKADCQASIDLPAKIVINESQGTYDADLTASPSNCIKTAQYRLELNGNDMGTLVFNRASSEVFTVTDSDGTGEYSAVFLGGTSTSGGKLYGNDSETPAVAKYGSRATVTASSRSGKKVTISALAEGWTAQYHDYDPSYRTTVQFQIKSAGGWQTLASVKTSRKGVATATVNAKSTARAKFRVVTKEDGARWGATSATVTR